MLNNQHSANFRRGALNTLAQTGTSNLANQAIIVAGNGSDLSNCDAMKKRAKRKTITQAMMLNMIDLCDREGTDERRKAFWNTYHCQAKVYTIGGKLYARYCKNRHCLLCCSIRKADIINRYLPVIQKWEEPYFLTLTVKAVPYKNLNAVMKRMIETFRKIIEKYKKQNQRGKGIKLKGVRSLESNFNPVAKTYNPHFHCIVANKQMAEIIMAEWLKRSKPGKTNRAAQNMTRIFNNVTALIEVVKYGSKIFTDHDIDKKSKIAKQGKGQAKIYAAALYNIFRSMKGLRIFERFGFNLPKDAKPLPVGTRVVKDFYEWNFHAPSNDWLSIDTGNPLSNFIASFDLLSLLKNFIDNKLE